MYNHNVTAIILAAGTGSRMKSSVSKQKMMLAGESILKRSIRAFEESKTVNSIILVVKEDEIVFAEIEAKGFGKVHKIVIGGKCRAESARNGFLNIDANTDFIAIHDAARCLVKSADIDKVVLDAVKFGAATASTKLVDTLKSSDENGFVSSTLNRDSLYYVQTPQAFSKKNYEAALNSGLAIDSSITDDNMLMEKIGIKVYLTDTDVNNIKITTKKDLEFAEFLLRGNLNV